MNARRLPLLDLPPREIELLIRKAVPAARLVSAELIRTGSANTNYRVRVDGESEGLAVRIVLRDPDTCAKEANLIRRLAPLVPVPRLLYAEFAPESLRYPFMVTSWIEGTTLRDALSSPLPPQEHAALGKAVGCVLARLGEMQFQTYGMLGPDLSVTPWSVAFGGKAKSGPDDGSEVVAIIEGYLNRHAGENLGREGSERVLRLARREMRRFAPEGKARLVHSDFNPTNILVRREHMSWMVSGVIDWEWAHSGSPLFDIANLMRHEHLISERFESAFVDAFLQGGGSLPADWREHVLVLDLINLIEMIDASPPLHEAQRRVLARIWTSLERLGA